MIRIGLLALTMCVLCGGALVAAFWRPAAPEPQPAPQPHAPDAAASMPPARAPEPESEPADPPEVEPYPPLMRFGDSRLRHTAPVTSLALTADGSRLLTATDTEPVLRLWDVKSGRLLRAVRVREEPTALTVVAITPDARTAFVVRNQCSDKESDEWWTEPATVDLLSGVMVRWPLPLRVGDRYPAFALSPDGKTLAGVIGNEVRVWEPGSGVQRVLGTIPGSNEFKGSICFSPDGVQIAATRGKSAVFLAPANGNGPLQPVPVECENGDVLAVFWQHPNRVVALWRRGLVAFDPTTGTELARVKAFEGNMYSLPRAVAGGGQLFGQEQSDPVVTFDLATLARVPDRAYGCRTAEPVAVSADGRVLAVARGHAVRLFDTPTGTSLHPDLTRAPSEPLVQFDISPDGACVLGRSNYSAHARGLSDGRVLAEFECAPRQRTPSALSPDGRFAAGRRSKNGDPIVVEVQTARDVAISNVVTGVGTNRVVGFTGPNRVWLWSDDDNVFTPVEIGTNRTGAAVAGFDDAEAVAVSPDGRTLAASGHKGLAIHTPGAGRGWDVLDNYEERKKAPACQIAMSFGVPVRFSPCGRWLLVSDFGLELWDVRGKPVRVGHFGRAALPGFADTDELSDGAFSPDGRFLAAAVRAADGETELCVWETASGAEVYRFRPARGVAGCAFTPDGRRLVIGHNDTTLSVWDRRAVEARQLGAVPAGEEWQWLGGRDARRAHAAARALVENPARGLAVLAPLFAPADVANVNRLIADLDAEEYRVRENAARALAERGLRAEPALRAALAAAESPEVRARAGALWKALGPSEGRLTGERLRATRAVGVLERIGSPEARALLAAWATDFPDSTLTPEVRAALARLGKK